MIATAAARPSTSSCRAGPVPPRRSARARARRRSATATRPTNAPTWGERRSAGGGEALAAAELLGDRLVGAPEVLASAARPDGREPVVVADAIQEAPVALLRVEELLADRVGDDVGRVRLRDGRIQLVEVAADLPDPSPRSGVPRNAIVAWRATNWAHNDARCSFGVAVWQADASNARATIATTGRAGGGIGPSVHSTSMAERDHNPAGRRLHLPIVGVTNGPGVNTPGVRKPPWLKVRLASGPNHAALKELMRDASLHTVCEEAMCPNIGECWEQREATFLILGAKCTRRCGFCDVMTARPIRSRRTSPSASRRRSGRWDCATSCSPASHATTCPTAARGSGRPRSARAALPCPASGSRCCRPTSRAAKAISRRCSTPSPTCSPTTSRPSDGSTTGSGRRSATTAPWTCCGSPDASGRSRSRSRT